MLKKIRDGCTLFLNGTHSSCCDLHDIDYTAGSISRKYADIKLKRCVRRIREEQYLKDWFAASSIKDRSFLFIKYTTWKILAVLMYAAVRTFGWYWWEKGRWIRDEKPTGDNWWMLGRLKIKFSSKYKR